MFCSDEVCEVLHPFQPILQQTLACGPHFDTSVVSKSLLVRREFTHGVIVIDGDEAVLGIWQASDSPSHRSAKLMKVAHLHANIASRTRRGGSSAARYSRNRDGEEKAFLRKVVVTIGETLGDVRNVVVGGRADMKHKLVSELPQCLRDRVARVVNLQVPAGLAALQGMAAHMQCVVVEEKAQKKGAAVDHFMALLAQTEMHEAPLVCYGEAETRKALEMGAVRELLVASTLATWRSCQTGGWRELAAASGASLVEIVPTCEASVKFCEGFGVGACLRYAVDPTLFEKEAEPFTSDVECKEGRVASIAEACMESKHLPVADCDSSRTAPSETDDLFRNWLVESLALDVPDPAAAESLAICTEVVLFDDTVPFEERLVNVLEMLRGEGVCEEVLVELGCHASDLFGVN